MDNSYLLKHAFKNPEDINYLVTAFSGVVIKNETHIFNNLDKKLDNMSQSLQQDIASFEDRINRQIGKLNFKINSVVNNNRGKKNETIVVTR